MKLQNTLIAIAKGSTVDKQDGSLSIFKIFSRFNFALTKEQQNHISEEHEAEKPHLLPQSYTFVSSWIPEIKKKDKLVESMNITMQLTTENSDGDIVAQQDTNAAVTFNESAFNININLVNVPVTGEGVYEMTLKIIDPATDKVIGKASTSYIVTFQDPNNP